MPLTPITEVTLGASAMSEVTGRKGLYPSTSLYPRSSGLYPDPGQAGVALTALAENTTTLGGTAEDSKTLSPLSENSKTLSPLNEVVV